MRPIVALRGAPTRCRGPGTTASGASSASGSSTNSRSWSRGCGHGQARLVDRPVAVEQQVEVDRARPPARALAHAAELALDLEQPVEQRARRQARSRARRRRSGTRGWSTRPHGSVSRIVERRRAPSSSAAARGSLARGRRGSRRARRTRASRPLDRDRRELEVDPGRAHLRLADAHLHALGRELLDQRVGDRGRERLEQREAAVGDRAAPRRRPRGSRPRPRCGRSAPRSPTSSSTS